MEERRGLLTWHLSIDLTRLLHRGEPGESVGGQRCGVSHVTKEPFCDLTLLGCDISSCLDLLIGYPQAVFFAEAVSLENPLSVANSAFPGQNRMWRSDLLTGDLITFHCGILSNTSFYVEGV